MKQPYEMTREEFYAERDSCRPCISQSKLTASSASEAAARYKKLNHLCFGVHEWIFYLAFAGDKDARDKLEYGYDLYDEVINKAKSMRLI